MLNRYSGIQKGYKNRISVSFVIRQVLCMEGYCLELQETQHIMFDDINLLVRHDQAQNYCRLTRHFMMQ